MVGPESRQEMQCESREAQSTHHMRAPRYLKHSWDVGAHPIATQGYLVAFRRMGGWTHIKFQSRVGLKKHDEQTSCNLLFQSRVGSKMNSFEE